MTDDQRWQAVAANDRRFDGVFFYGVTSTGVFCRPSCPSRPPRRDRVQFFSRRRLTELFRQTYGTTPGACLTALRLSEACRLLRQTDLSVAHVAGEAGFESLSAFYRAFRRELGCSPGTYRTKEMSP